MLHKCPSTGIPQCPVGWQSILGVMSDFDPIELKFGVKVEFDVLNNLPKFGHNQLIRGLALTPPK